MTADLGAAGSRIGGRPDIWEIALIHTTFRREFATLPGLVHGLADAEAAHAAALGDHWQFLRDALRVHLEAEETRLWPCLVGRAAWAEAAVVRLERQHVRILGLVGEVDRLAVDLASGKCGDTTRNELACTLAVLSSALCEHFEEEERDLLPMVQANVTRLDWDRFASAMREDLPPDRVVLLVGAMLESASEVDGYRLMAISSPILQVDWARVGAPAYEAYVARVRGGQTDKS